MKTIKQYLQKSVVVQYDVYSIKAGRLINVTPDKIKLLQNKTYVVPIQIKSIQKIMLVDDLFNKK